MSKDIDLALLQWLQPADVDQYDFVLLQWDEKLLETVVPELLLPVARMVDSYIHSSFASGYSALTDSLRRRIALAVLYTEQRPAEELYHLAIECARKEAYARNAPSYLAAAFASPEDIREWAQTHILTTPMKEACSAYARGDYHGCMVRVLDTFRDHREGQRAILRVWLTPSSAHRSVPE